MIVHVHCCKYFIALKIATNYSHVSTHTNIANLLHKCKYIDVACKSVCINKACTIYICV